MDADTLQVKRWHLVFLLFLLQLWPLCVVAKAYLFIPSFKTALSHLLGGGAGFPELALFVLSTYPYWIAVPVVTTGLAIYANRKNASVVWMVLAAALTILSSLAMETLLILGVDVPLSCILRKISQ